METYEILEKALSLIENERNWCQGTILGPRNSTCALGAVVQASLGYFKNDWRDSADGMTLRAISALADHIPVPFFRPAPREVIWHFNDTSTHAEVTDLFRKAIRKEKAKLGIEIEVPASVSVSQEAVAV